MTDVWRPVPKPPPGILTTGSSANQSSEFFTLMLSSPSASPWRY
jgi:hypothetical protein